MTAPSSSSTPRGGTRAVLTMARDEALRLPIWLRYYSRFFAPDDIYVLDHGSTDGSTDGAGFVRVPVDHESVVEIGWMWETIQAHQHRLLRDYETVLYTDVDEIVAPDPRTGTLGEYIDRFDGDYVVCSGYELIHIRDREAPLDLSRPVLEQRAHWFPSSTYSKPLLSRVPLHWRVGGHRCAEGPRPPDPDLYLIHLHRMDYDLCLEKHRRWRSWRWSDVDLDRGYGYQNLITEPDRFHRWFYEDAHNGDEPPRLERIPDRWRKLF